MQLVRRISQILFVLLFFLLFLLATYPLVAGLPVALFLQMDPLLAISTMISAKAFILKSLPALILLLLTLPFGRFFCGWICPLGSIIDGADTLIKGKCVNTPFVRWKWIKFGILTAVLLAALMSVQFAGLLDPIPLLTRSVTVFIYPLFVLAMDGILGLFMSLPFLENAAFSAYEALRGNLLPVTTVTFTSAIAVSVLFILILGSGFLHKRFWCRNLCPLGAMLGTFSAGRRYKRVVDEACTACGICRNRCRMDAIGEDFITTNHIECISCMDCQAVCPVGAVHFTFPKKSKITRPDFTRRQFLTAGAAGAVTAGIFGLTYVDPGRSTILVRPPGALEERPFLDRCIRCGECVRICSSAGAGLQLAGFEGGLNSIWTPILRAKTGYCEYNCNLCGAVCPTGAIQKLSLEEKQEMKMGTAHFDKTRCIPWYYGEDCLVCEEHCPLPEKAIKFQETHIITITGAEADVLLPYVDEGLCVGCGICVNRCPVEGSRGIFITNAGEMRL